MQKGTGKIVCNVVANKTVLLKHAYGEQIIILQTQRHTLIPGCPDLVFYSV